MAQAQNGDTAKGCGCLLAIVLVIGGLAASCLGGPDDPVARPAYTVPSTTSTTSSPSSAAAPVRVVRYECTDFTSQLEAQSAFDAGGQEHLDPDADGLACDNHFARRSTPAPQTRYTDSDDDSSSSGSTRRRTGNSGHPCLPGERDGDGDGYCGEG
ncbi:hypothetical protein [Actinomycetospora atypica]|uniref:Excalibur calcium-binding domain-containing protein n=1 Tax=Actinomycetospora atypica TaxID=1290095 RepID=A0ABV9YFI0_9PSEU